MACLSRIHSFARPGNVPNPFTSRPQKIYISIWAYRVEPPILFILMLSKYKVSDEPMILRGFGRNAQSMVAHALTIEDREQRTAVAHEIVRVLTNLNPDLRDVPEYKQQLWDAVFIMSDWKLDVDAPFPAPPKPDETDPFERMDYYREKPRYRQYGKNIEFMIDNAVEMEEGPKRTAYINLIASTMKQFLRNINREDTPEQVLADQINELSGHRLRLKGEELTLSKVTLPPLKQHSGKSNRNKRKSKSSSRNKNNKNNRRRKKPNN